MLKLARAEVAPIVAGSARSLRRLVFLLAGGFLLALFPVVRAEAQGASPTSEIKVRDAGRGGTRKAASCPTCKVDPSKPFAHPYYWEPFILIGNWK